MQLMFRVMLFAYFTVAVTGSSSGNKVKIKVDKVLIL